MPDVTLTFTNAQLNELKAALRYIGSLDATPDDAAVKAWIVNHAQGAVNKHRAIARDSANPISTAAAAT